MGQTESRPQDPGSKEENVWILGCLSKIQDQGKLPDGTEIKISSQMDRLLRCFFVWQQDLEDRNCLIDRSFEMKSKTGETIKIGIILSYDSPNLSFKRKIIQGADLFTNMKVLRIGFSHGNRRLAMNSFPNELLEEEYVKTFDLGMLDAYKKMLFDEILLDESDGSKKTVSLDIGFEFQLKEKPPTKIDTLPQKLEKMFAQGNEFSDVKIICDGRIFDCHKIILSCQSEVFKGTNLIPNICNKYICS